MTSTSSAASAPERLGPTREPLATAPPTPTDLLRGSLAFLGAAATLALILVCMRRLGREIDAPQQLVLRNTIALVLALLLLRLSGIALDLRFVRRASVLGFCIVFPLSTLLATWATQLVEANTAAFASFFSSLFAGVLFGRLVFGERPDRVTLAAIGVAIFGLAVFSYPVPTDLLLSAGFGVGLLGGVAKIGTVTLRKSFTREVHPLLVVVVQALASIAIGALFMQGARPGLGGFAQLTATGWLVGFLYGALTVVAVGFLMVGTRYAPVGLSAIVLAMELPLVAGFAYALLGEVPTRAQLLGALLLVAATALPNASAALRVLRGRTP